MGIGAIEKGSVILLIEELFLSRNFSSVVYPLSYQMETGLIEFVLALTGM